MMKFLAVLQLKQDIRYQYQKRNLQNTNIYKPSINKKWKFYYLVKMNAYIDTTYNVM